MSLYSTIIENSNPYEVIGEERDPIKTLKINSCGKEDLEAQFIDKSIRALEKAISGIIDDSSFFRFKNSAPDGVTLLYMQESDSQNLSEPVLTIGFKDINFRGRNSDLENNSQIPKSYSIEFTPEEVLGISIDQLNIIGRRYVELR
jgi:hypothetical protein